MNTAQKRRREARAALGFVRLLEVATKAGFEVHCKHYGDYVSCLVVLEEWHPQTMTVRNQVGSVSVRLAGPYLDDGPDGQASHVSGVGITLACRAKLLTEGRAHDYLPLGGGDNSTKEQQRWFDRADAEKARRSSYGVKVDGKCACAAKGLVGVPCICE